jgi:hypothetical protein
LAIERLGDRVQVALLKVSFGGFGKMKKKEERRE